MSSTKTFQDHGPVLKTILRIQPPDGTSPFDVAQRLTGRPDAIWALMNLLASHTLSNPTPVLDLRKRRMSAVAGTLMEVARGERAAA